MWIRTQDKKIVDVNDVQIIYCSQLVEQAPYHMIGRHIDQDSHSAINLGQYKNMLEAIIILMDINYHLQTNNPHVYRMK